VYLFAYLVLSFKDDNQGQAETFSVAMLFSWMSLLQYLRVFKEFRYLAELIVGCLSETQSFLGVLMILMTGFATAFYYRNLLDYSIPKTSFG